MKTVFGVLALTLIAAPSFADEDPSAPYFRIKDGERLPLKETVTQVVVAGVIAHVRQRQVYTNEGAETIEATYVFSGSTQAALFAMTMKIGTRTIIADIEKRDEARRRYETAKNEGKTASLLEQHRPNVFSMNVANILPGDRIEVEVEYSELLVPEAGVYELILPGAVRPRFDGEASQRESWNENPHIESARVAKAPKWSASVRIAGGLPIRAVSSPTHEIAPHFPSERSAKIDVLDPAGGQRDFVLRYRLDGDEIQTGVLLHEGPREKFFTAIIQPPRRVAPDMIPPREYVFVVDVSGSMSGFPIDTAKRLMNGLLDDLRPQDRFNVLLFAGAQELLSSESVPATPENVDRAVDIVDRMRGGGGTQMFAALDRAFALPRNDDVSTTIVVITDGFVTVEAETYRLVRDRLGTANLFAFGIGRAVNRNLVESLARAGLGRPFVVTQPSEARAAATRFKQYVEQPVLTKVRLEIDGLDAYDVSPKSMPDLFGERPLVVFGKYRGNAKGTFRVRGRTGASDYSGAVVIDPRAVSDDLVALKFLWARDRIGQLADMADESERARAEVTSLGLRYHLMTQFTSLVAVDDGRRNHQGPPVPVRQSTNVTYPMKFMASSGAAHVMGSLDRNTIADVIRRHTNDIRRVYERALKSHPNMQGRIVLRLVIGPDGRVETATIAGSTLKDPELEKALLRVARKMRFPAPAGGGKITVSYPFVFSPG